MKDLKGLKIHCDNEEEKRELLEEATKQGFKWGSGHEPLEYKKALQENDFDFCFEKRIFCDTTDCISYKEYKAMSEFTKADLKPCMVVVRRNGCVAGIIELQDGINLQTANGSTLCLINEYGDDLTKTNLGFCGRAHDIMQVYGFGAGKFEISTDNRPLLWERKEEPQTEEMTLVEVCKALGKNIKIVKE